MAVSTQAEQADELNHAKEEGGGVGCGFEGSGGGGGNIKREKSERQELSALLKQ